jgi:hypothetical protein
MIIDDQCKGRASPFHCSIRGPHSAFDFFIDEYMCFLKHASCRQLRWLQAE